MAKAKKQSAPAPVGGMIPVDTKIEVVRPHPLWSGLCGYVEKHDGNLHVVRLTTDRGMSFSALAQKQHLKVIP